MKTFQSLRECRQYWNQVVKNYSQSGLSQAEFARRNAVSIKSLFYWISRHRKKQSFAVLGLTAEGKCVSAPAEQPLVKFVPLPVHVVPHQRVVPTAKRLILRIGGKFRLSIPAGFCPETLASVVRILE